MLGVAPILPARDLEATNLLRVGSFVEGLPAERQG